MKRMNKLKCSLDAFFASGKVFPDGAMRRLGYLSRSLASLGMTILLLSLTGMRDPTQPPDAIMKKSSKGELISTKPLELTATFIYPSYRLAIINGQTLMEGEKIGEYLITTINKDTVELKGPQNAMVVLQLSATVKHAREY